jgi:hypothetical protein
MGDSEHATADRQTAGSSVGRDVVVVALGILAAVAVLVVVMQLSRPSSIDCATQRVEVSNGTRDAVDSACDGR